MANNSFRTKFGLTVGDDRASINGTTGNIFTYGNLQVNGSTTLGNDYITDTLTVNGGVAGNIEFTDNSTTTIRGTKGTVGTNDYWHIGGAATGSNAGYAEIATGDDGTEPIYVKQYTSGTATSTLTLLDASHNTFLAGDLTLGGNGYIYSTTDLALQLSGANVRTPGDLTINGGDLIGTRPLQISTTDTFATTGSSISGTTLTIGTLTSGTISVGMAITGGTTVNGTVITANISGSGSGSTWTINTSQTVASSSITGAGNITLAPITAGSVALSLANGGNLTNNRNYVHGVIRNTTTANTNGDIWELNTSAAQSATNPYFRGLSLDNSADTTRGPANLMRSYSGGAVSGSGSRGRLIFEKARGTAASPTAVQSADVLGSVDVTGYTSTGWLNDTIPAITGTSTFAATENWVSNTNLGTNFNVALAPTATTIASGANLITVLSVSPQTNASRSDAFTWANGKTGTTQTMALDVSGNLTVTGDVRINGNNIQNSAGLASIDLTSGNTITIVRANTALFQTAADVEYASINATGSEFTCSGITNYIRTGTSSGVFPPLLARYKRSDTTGSNNGDGSQILLGTGGTTTTDNLARFDATYVTGGNHQFGIAVSSDSFSSVTNSTYKATREKTEILATATGGGTSNVIMEVTNAQILNNRAHRNALTTGTVARGGDYAVPATANGSIELTITAGSGITHIDVDAVASDAATGGMYSILIYNNSGNNNIDVQVRNNGVNIGLANNMDAGDRAMASVYVVGGYAACEIMDAA